MSKRLRVLMVEDSKDDADILLRELRTSGHVVTSKRVEKRTEFTKALGGTPWDIIIADYSLPSFGAKEALEILKARNEEMPFVVVSGKVGEEAAVEIIRAGANDFCMKSHLGRIVTVIERELRDSRLRREHREQRELWKKERKLLSTLMDSVPDSIYFKDRQGKFTLINRHKARKSGLKNPAEAVGKTDFDFFSEEHAKEAQKDERLVMKTGRALVNREEKETWPDGRVTWVSTTKLPLRDKKGKSIGTFGISRDITERKRAEEALRESEKELRKHRDHLEDLVAERTAELKKTNTELQQQIRERELAEKELQESEERYRAIFKQAPDSVVLIDVDDGSLAEFNDRAHENLGYSRKEFEKLRIAEIDVVDSEADFLERCRRILQKGSVTFETQHRAKKGDIRDVRVTTAPIEIGGKTYIQAFCQDITDRKRMERSLRESERLEAVSTLADGVAHNFNNIISVIRGYASSIADNLLPNTRAHEDAIHILEAAKHAMTLTKRIVSVAQAGSAGEEARVAPVSVGRVISDTLELVEHTLWQGNVQVEVKEQEAMPYVMADANQLLDALMNLFLNALEAMPDGGRIMVGTTPRKVLRPRHTPNAVPGLYVDLWVRDTGRGMDKDTLARVFEPFFTTDQSGSSFGLGLTVVQSMVQNWGGWVTVRSKPGSGSMVRLMIPEAAPPKPAGEGKQPAVGHTILLVDDDAEMLAFMQDALEDAEHKVYAAGDAEGGISLYKDKKDEISACVIDVTMPGNDGGFVLEEILKMEPQANVIMTSGFSRDYVRHVLPLGAWSFLQKPFDGRQLVDAVNHLLPRGDRRHAE